MFKLFYGGQEVETTGKWMLEESSKSSKLYLEVKYTTKRITYTSVPTKESLKLLIAPKHMGSEEIDTYPEYYGYWVAGRWFSKEYVSVRREVLLVEEEEIVNWVKEDDLMLQYINECGK